MRFFVNDLQNRYFVYNENNQLIGEYDIKNKAYKELNDKEISSYYGKIIS